METTFDHRTDWGLVRVHRYGTGPRLILAQHGFGRDGRRFRRLGEIIGDHYTLLAPDLPFHGATHWTEPHLTPDQWQSLLIALANDFDAAQFHFLGHSLGGRIGMKLFPALQPRLASFCLVAPDGLGGPYTHWIDRLPAGLIRTLSKTLAYPRGILGLAGRLRRWRLIDDLSHQYLLYQLRDASFRNRLRGTLRSLPAFRLYPRRAVRQLAAYPRPVQLFLGRHDRLVDADQIQHVLGQAKNVAIDIADGGHGLPFESLQTFYLKIQ